MQRFCLRTTAAFTVSALVLLTGALHAASDIDIKPSAPVPKKDEIRVPIPGWAPDVTSNGCRVRKTRNEPAPAAEVGGAQIPFASLISHAVGRYAVWAVLETPDVFAKRIASLDDGMRRLTYLVALRDWLGRDGLHTFFFLAGGAHAFAIRDVLKDAGLAREHDLFVRAMALFGPDYPIDNRERAKLFAYSTADKELNAFDHALMALARQFGDKQSFTPAIVMYVNRTPALFAAIEGQREKMSDEARFRELDQFLARKINWRKPADDIARQLAALPAHERHLIALSMFNMAFENGGVHQFFYNSSGDIAPEVLDAMVALDLRPQADIFRRALAMLPGPYIRDNEARRAKHFPGTWADWDKKLSALTDDFYKIGGGAQAVPIKGALAFEGGPGLREAVLNLARTRKLLPC